MTGAEFETTDLNPAGYPFCAGKVAMSTNYLWSTYCVDDAGDDWNMAATPSYNGTTTGMFNADTWRIMKTTKNPEQAFEVLQYLLANEDLLSLYGGMPAVESKQDAFLEAQFADYAQGIDTNVAKEGVAFADVPNFESYMPAYNQTLDLINTYSTKWQTTPGLRPRRRDRGDALGDAGRLGRRRQLIRWSPQRRAAAHRAPVWARGGARAGGTSSSRRGSSVSAAPPAPSDGRDARLSFTNTFAGFAMPVAVVVPLLFALLLHPADPRRVRRVPDAAVRAVRRAVRRDGLHLGRDAQPGLDQRRAQGPRRQRSTAWLEDPTWVYPGLALIEVWGIGAGMIVYLAALRACRRTCTRRPEWTVPGRGRHCDTSRSRCSRR